MFLWPVSDFDALLLEEVLERLARLRILIESLNKVVSERERELLTFYREQLDAFRTDTAILPGLLAHKQFQSQLLQSVQSTLLRFYTFHHQFHRFTRFPEVRPEISAMVEELSGSAAFLRPPAIIYTDMYNYFESSVTLAFQQAGILATSSSEEYFTLVLPYSEFQNPLSWANLVHELAHTIDEAPVDRAFAKGPEIAHPVGFRWARELFCDMVAIRLMGPAYFCSFTSVLLTLPKESWLFSDSHPQALERLRVMYEYLQEKDLLTPAVLIYREAFLQLTKRLGVEHFTWPQTAHLKPGAPSSPELLDNLAREVDDLKLDGVFTKENKLNASTLSMNLLSGIPLIAGYHSAEVEGLRKELASYRNLAQDLTQAGKSRLDETYDLLKKVQDSPATTAEILTAAWEHKVTRFPDVLCEAFSGTAEDGFVA